jgi:hypothetical protein
MTPTVRRSFAMLTASAILVLLSALMSCASGGPTPDSTAGRLIQGE